VRLVLAVVVSLGLIIADHRYGQLDGLRAAVGVAVYPLQLLADLPVHLLYGARGRLAKEGELREANEALQRQNLLLSARLQRLESLEAENMRLRDLLGSSFEIGDRVLIAEMLAADLDPSRQQVLINKGSRSGVYPGQPVIDADAVMGQVTRVNPFSSTVLMITDSEHAIPVEVVRNGLRTVAAGTGLSQTLTLLHVPKNADVRVGDRLVTSGMGGRFPRGYPVARVSDVRHEPDSPFTVVLAEPTARLDRSREVLLVWTLSPEAPESMPDDAADPAAPAGGDGVEGGVTGGPRMGGAVP
jgi:rod shape-determining protein MreC